MQSLVDRSWHWAVFRWNNNAPDRAPFAWATALFGNPAVDVCVGHLLQAAPGVGVVHVEVVGYVQQRQAVGVLVQQHSYAVLWWRVQEFFSLSLRSVNPVATPTDCPSAALWISPISSYVNPTQGRCGGVV